MHNVDLEVILESYIIRIYRRGNKIPHNLIGVVEEVGVEGKKSFTSLDELWSILNPIKSTPEKGKGPRRHTGKKRAASEERME
jgi:hypothetical protein